jgi:hypothetical protein
MQITPRIKHYYYRIYDFKILYVLYNTKMLNINTMYLFIIAF